MLPLVLDIDILEIWFSSKGEAFSDVAYCHYHLLIFFDAHDVFYVSVNELFVELDVLELRGDIHDVEDTVRNVVVLNIES